MVQLGGDGESPRKPVTEEDAGAQLPAPPIPLRVRRVAVCSVRNSHRGVGTARGPKQEGRELD